MSSKSTLPALLLLGLLLALLTGCEAKPATDAPLGGAALASAPQSAGSIASPQGNALCEHGVAAAVCPKCNPALAAVFKAKGDWCDSHGFPESFCPICHPGSKAPEVAAATDAPAADWCVEHALPESKCTACNPSLVARYKAAGDWCPEHGFPESVCPECNPQKPPPGAEVNAIEARVVRLRDPGHEAAAGIRTVSARSIEAAQHIDCNAQLAYNQDKLADIRAVVPGVVRRVRVKLGQQVKPGQALFDVQSTEVGQAQGQLQRARGRVKTAKANLKRQLELQRQGLVAERDVELAEQEVSGAQGDRRATEVTVNMTGASRSGASGRFTLTSPISGTVVSRAGVVGLLATDETSLASVADISSMWLLCAVPEADASRLALGQRVTLSSGAGGGQPGGEQAAGDLAWISPAVDPRTRTVTARAELPNPTGALRANLFVTARINVTRPQPMLAVPRAAVQRVGDREVVFVRIAPATFAPRVVVRRGGAGQHAAGGSVQVEGRLTAGDLVVTDGAVLLRTEVMPGSLGAGCCEVSPTGGG